LIYLDSSALVKLVLAEPETAALVRWLADSPSPAQVSSSIIRVEVPRAVWRAEPELLPHGYAVIQRVREVLITDAVLRVAASARPPTLRSMDAIHLASALVIRRDLAAFVSYDKRLLVAAKEAGLSTASPV